MSNEVAKVEVIASPEFQRRLKALAKRYRKVYDDLQPIFEDLESGIFLGDQISGTNYTVLKLRIRKCSTTEKILMDSDRLPNIHPGEILRMEFLEPLEITPYRLSKDIGVAQTRIGEILSEKHSITADTALRLSKYFGNSAQFWMNLQTQYDLRQAQEENREIYTHIPVVQLTHLN
ncbi:HigA protein [Leptolyngbya sp. NIES-2104]|nr:HigA protein [Leptolyngbya sp. NIES-2104]